MYVYACIPDYVAYMYRYILQKPILPLLSAVFMTAPQVIRSVFKKKKKKSHLKGGMRMEWQSPFSIK